MEINEANFHETFIKIYNGNSNEGKIFEVEFKTLANDVLFFPERMKV